MRKSKKKPYLHRIRRITLDLTPELYEQLQATVETARAESTTIPQPSMASVIRELLELALAQ